MQTTRRRGWRRIAAVALSAAALAACEKAPQPVERAIVVKDRTARIRLAASDAPGWVTLYGTTQRMMQRVADSLDANDAGSDVAKINRIGNDARIQIAHDTFRLLDLARHYAELSDGAYDFTIAPVAWLWGFEGGPAPTNEPPADLVQAALLGVGAGHLSLFDNSSAALTHPQARISVAALADGYAADMALVEARTKGIRNACVEIGRSARALGSARADAAWDIPLRDPFFTNGILGRLVLGDGVAFSSAALRDRTVAIGDRTFGHILNPRIGEPAHGTALAVVAGPIATKCSALAQALVVVGAGGASAVVARFERCEALIVPDAQPLEIWMTRGFAQHVRLNPGLEGAVKYIEVDRPADAVTDDGEAPAINAVPANAAPAEK